MIKPILLVFTIALLLTGCKKEPTTWQPNWTAPLAKGKLSLSDMLPDYSAENTDGFASLIFNDTVYSFSIDTLIKLPDTALVQKTAVAFSSVSLGPGSFIENNDIDQLYDLGDISLKRVIVKKGMAFITVSSPWAGKTKAIFEFPKVKDNAGNILSRTYFLEPGTNANPFVVYDTIDIANYDFDLTGASGGLANYLTANMSIYSNEETASFTVTNLDTVLLSLTFSGLEPKYARGYFGQYDLSDTTALKFPEIRKLSGLLALDSLRMTLNIQNGFDLIAQAKISELYGRNTATNQSILLNFPFLNQFLNINPATGGLYDSEPSNYYLSMNSDNSTIIPFIENLPDSIVFGYQIKINPDGNTGAGTDQFFPNSSFNLLADAELPLHIKLDQFTITDTFKIDASAIEENIQSGSITLSYTNSFPLSANVPLKIMNAAGTVLDSIIPSEILKAGNYQTASESTLPVVGQCKYSLSQSQIENLVNGGYISVAATFNTSNIAFVKINMTDAIDFTLTTDLNLKISI
ncbi:MAG: hypothetical protein R3279_03570 [Putridiphycobacter sp.]|nr:hypothetical protein [Putridiphycobacter sp.]